MYYSRSGNSFLLGILLQSPLIQQLPLRIRLQRPIPRTRPHPLPRSLVSPGSPLILLTTTPKIRHQTQTLRLPLQRARTPPRRTNTRTRTRRLAILPSRHRQMPIRACPAFLTPRIARLGFQWRAAAVPCGSVCLRGERAALRGAVCAGGICWARDADFAHDDGLGRLLDVAEHGRGAGYRSGMNECMVGGFCCAQSIICADERNSSDK